MLKIAQLYDDLHRLAEDSGKQAADRAARRRDTVAAFGRHTADLDRLHLRAADARTSWLVADFDGDPAVTAPAGPAGAYTVVSVDGSQIFPDRHGAATCYVINLGQVVLRYGDDPAATLDSQPTLYADEADVYQGQVGERRAVGADEVGIHRTVLELEELLRLAQAQADPAVVALADGTLIPWMMNGTKGREEDPWREGMRQRYLAALAGFEAAQIAVASYISRSGASDVVHLVRVGECNEARVDCDHCAKHGPLKQVLARHGCKGKVLTLAQSDELPCGRPAGLCDGDLFGLLLQAGERSAPFRTRSKAFDGGDQRVTFFYINTGTEIARVETPAWVAADPARLAQVHAVVADQVRKGRGYPVALMEAHEQAIVRGPDRVAFERLLQRILVQQGQTVRWSEKGRSKQQPGV